MGALTFSAIGTATIRPQYKMELDALDPGRLMSTDGRFTPSAAEAAADAKTPLAARLREDTLKTMGLGAGDLAKMKPETRADLERHLARFIHEQVLNAPNDAKGAFVDTRA
jgi:hypothetical protein